MKKRIILFIIIIALLFGTVIVPGTAVDDYAAEAASKSAGELKDELEDVNELKEEATTEAAKVAEELEAIEKELEVINGQVKEAAAQVAAVEAEIKAKQAELIQRETDLNQRLIVMYKKGSMGFLDVLLGSQGIVEFISNIKLIQEIYQCDQDVMTILQDEYDALSDIRNELAEKKAQLDEKKQTLADQQAKLKSQKAKLDALAEKYEKEMEELEKEIAELTSTGDAEGIFLIWPLPSKYRTKSRITSRYGMRRHPIYKTYKMHNGNDIGVPKGVEIYAAAAGTVKTAKYHNSYGNYVMIDHGNGVMTLYAHASVLKCKAGDKVKAGDVIALVGSTGDSTGNHLHYEVRINGKAVDSLQYYPDLYKYFV